jgi:PAS domain-containing protein
VSVHTAAGFFAASLAYFRARPENGMVSIAASDSNSGFLLRTLVPAIIAVPILLGWLKLAGQRANLYDAPLGVALLVLGNIGCLSGLTMLIVRSMHHFERERGGAEETLRASEEKFRRVFQDAATGMVMISLEGRFLAVNQAFCEFLGYSESELVGRDVLSVTPISSAARVSRNSPSLDEDSHDFP